MTVMKAGSASTLDIIDGVKTLLPRSRQTLPPGSTSSLSAISPIFVQVRGLRRRARRRDRRHADRPDDPAVPRQLALDADHHVSIPLADPRLDRVLSAIGQTINVMTLGGLALAVGILVDDATVTIENINWHLEQGKPMRDRDPGRRPADRRAGLRVAALHLHRLRADVRPRRRCAAICSGRWPRPSSSR